MEATLRQIEDEIEALKTMKPNVPPTSGFGDDNRAAIQAQITTLKEWLMIEDLDDKLESGEWTHYQYESAREAMDWVNGDSEDGAPPSEGWKPLIKKDK